MPTKPLNELRSLVRELILSEANVVGYANSQIGNLGLFRAEFFQRISLVVISSKETLKEPHVSFPKPLGLLTAAKHANAWRITKMYADSAPAAVMLLAAALESFKRVLADHDVSPAAQQVIKRYFDKNKADPAKIELLGDKSRGKNGPEPDFLSAAYLGPVGFDLNSALKHGEHVIDTYIETQDQAEVEAAIMNTAYDGFTFAYDSDSKTKRKKSRDEGE